VKTYLRISFIIIPLLFACAPKKSEMPMIEVPAGPLLHALEQRQQAFRGLKAVASVEIQKWGTKRTLENVGIVLDGQNRLRMEAYGPLGQSIMTLVWDGKEVLLRRPDSDRIEHWGQEGFAQFLGEGLDGGELCALLAGNIPAMTQPNNAMQFCGRNGDCVLEIRHDSSLRRIRVVYSASGSPVEPQIISLELHRSGKLIYHARFAQAELIAHYLLPMKIEIENPDHNLVLTIEYNSEIGVNTPISDNDFMLSDGEPSK